MTSKKRSKRPASADQSASGEGRNVEVLEPEDLTASDGFLSDSSQGLYGRDDNGHPYRVSDRVSVVANVSDSDGGSYGLLLAWKDNRKRAKRMIVPMEDFIGDPKTICSRLVSGGLNIEMGCHKELVAHLHQSAKRVKHMLLVRQIGWHHGQYVLPDHSFGTPKAEPVILDPAIETSKFSTSGSLQEWIDNVGKMCSGNSRLLFAVSGAFAGPLLKLAGEGSAIMHLRGASTGGKTTALKAASSVLGSQEDRNLLTWHSTENGIEATLASHNDSTFCLDELHEADPKTVMQTVYMIGNGTGKQRMSKELLSRNPHRWTALVLSSGEIDLASHAASSGAKVKGGAEVRMLNVEADAGAGMGVFEELHRKESPAEFATDLWQNASKFYGVVFREYLEILTQFDEGFLLDLMSDLKREFLDLCRFHNAAPEVQRAANKFALIALAGELATMFRLTGWKAGEARDGVLRCFESWRTRRGGDTVVYDERVGVEAVKQFIERFGSSRFEGISGAPNGRPILDRAGFKRHLRGGTVEYLFLPSIFKEEVCKGHDSLLVCKALLRDGHLRRQDPAYTIRTTVPEIGKTNLYCVLGSILSETT